MAECPLLLRYIGTDSLSLSSFVSGSRFEEAEEICLAIKKE